MESAVLTLIEKLGFPALVRQLNANPVTTAVLSTVVLFTLAVFALVLIRGPLLKAVTRLVRHSRVKWDDLLVDQRVFHRFSWAVPWLLVHQLAPLIPHGGPRFVDALQRFAVCALVVIILRALGAMMAAVNLMYAKHPMARHRPIKGYLQVLLIVAWVFGLVLIVATLLDRSPWLLLSGLGAMTAILLLVFRDTILSLVAGIQLTSNDLIRVGDWIEMPQFSADGDVIDISLHAISVQNWDKTITTIPTHRFLEHSFRNWRGMQASGGRRIKRAFHLDMSSIRFLEPADVDHFGRHVLLREYIAGKKVELDAFNREQKVEPGEIANARRLTNIGTLRAYVVAYLRQHPGVHQDMTLMVRQLAPTPEGLPLEIYIFTNDTAWAVYEGIQSDIFDHVLSMVPEFGLRVFQSPSGHDFAALGQRTVAMGSAGVDLAQPSQGQRGPFAHEGRNALVESASEAGAAQRKR